MKKLCFCFAVALIVAISAFSYGAAASAETYTLQESADALPASYTSPYISPIKDQGYHGNCWAFSTIATLESNLKAMGYLNPEAADGYFDLSEQAISYALTIKCSVCGGACSFVHGSLAFVCDECGGSGFGPNRTVNDPMLEGGFEEFVLGYLSSVRGALKESDVPYHSVLDAEPPENFDTLEELFRVTDIVSVVPTVENIKRGIMSYGAMTINAAVDSQKASIVQNSDGRYSYTLGATQLMPEMGAHAMSVVGFDDNFSKSNFKVDREGLNSLLDELQSSLPPKLERYLDLWGVESLEAFKAMSDEDFDALFLPKNDGAWLIKNSWGEGVRTFRGNGPYDICGLVWMSYEDVSLYNLLPNSRAYAVSGISTDDPSLQYRLDEFGGICHLPPTADINSASYAVANVFDFGCENQSKLDYIAFETAYGKGCAYEIYYSGLTTGGAIETEFSRMRLITGGIIPHDGYVTVRITDNIILPKGKGALVMKLCSPAEPVRIGLDAAYYDWYQYGNEVIMYYFPKISGNSFVISDGKIYSPLEAFGREADFSLRAGITPTLQAATVTVGYADYSEAKELLAALDVFGYTEAPYTKAAWQRYQNALAALKSLVDDPTLDISQQNTVDDAVVELENAVSGLDRKEDRVALFAALALVAALITVSLSALLLKLQKKRN